MTRTRLALINAIAIAVALGSAAPASAQSHDDQSGRAEALAGVRDQKAETVTPPTRSLTERALHWYDNHGLRLGWRAVHFTGGAFPQGAGFGYGVGLTSKALGSAIVQDDQPNRIDSALSAARSLKGYQRIAARIDLKNAAGRPVDLTVRWLDYRSPQEDFYGIGMNSLTSDRSNYGVIGHEFGAGVSWSASDTFSIGGEVAYLTADISEGTDPRFATMQSLFTEDEAPGLTDLPAFARANVKLEYDWRDSSTHPRRGGQYTATLANYSGIDDSTFDFRRVDVSAQQILPLPNKYRRIELRAAAAFTDGNAPIVYLPALGGTHVLRGFAESRFRDRTAIWASAEYQWEAWWALDAAFFVDAGQVAARRSDLSLDNFEITYGFGFRLHANENFIARLDLARGREGFHPILGFKYGF